MVSAPSVRSLTESLLASISARVLSVVREARSRTEGACRASEARRSRVYLRRGGLPVQQAIHQTWRGRGTLKCGLCYRCRRWFIRDSKTGKATWAIMKMNTRIMGHLLQFP